MPVFDRKSGEKLLLSAAHVIGGLARSWRADADVYTCDGNPNPAAQERIGNTIDTIPDTVVDACDIDAALVRLMDTIDCNKKLDRGSITRYIRDVTADDIGLIVHKRGCKTGETRGEFYEITDVLLRVRTSPKVDVLYSNVLSVISTGTKPFALEGDSGAILVDANNDVVGLIVGMEDPARADDPLTFATPIGAVLDALDVEL